MADTLTPQGNVARIALPTRPALRLLGRRILRVKRDGHRWQVPLLIEKTESSVFIDAAATNGRAPTLRVRTRQRRYETSGACCTTAARYDRTLLLGI
jgi:hypothetical protein